jgi:hypothetical protein
VRTSGISYVGGDGDLLPATELLTIAGIMTTANSRAPNIRKNKIMMVPKSAFIFIFFYFTICSVKNICNAGLHCDKEGSGTFYGYFLKK